MKLIVISGRSGSGKSTALHVLEDAGYYCIDNLPAELLAPLVDQLTTEDRDPPRVAVSIDARNTIGDLSQVPKMLEELAQERSVTVEIVFLDADSSTLIKRFSETRRKHPLSDADTGLKDAILREKQLLEPLAHCADLTIDSSKLTLHQLREQFKSRVVKRKDGTMSLLFQSFGFKNGVPVDADMVFDVRCLPNPHWHPHLRPLTGRDPDVQTFLSQQDEVQDMLADIRQYLDKWLPNFEANNRSYMTIAIGCTGGQHRSVYLTETLKKQFDGQYTEVQVKHRELN